MSTLAAPTTLEEAREALRAEDDKMTFSREEVAKTLEILPESFVIGELIDELLFLSEIRERLRVQVPGEGISIEEARARFGL